MPTFIALIDFTKQGAHAIKESPKRADSVIKMAGEAGLTVKDIYWTTGSHDGLLIVDGPDDKTVSAFFLSLVRLGNVRTTTLRAFDRREFILVFRHPQRILNLAQLVGNLLTLLDEEVIRTFGVRQAQMFGKKNTCLRVDYLLRQFGGGSFRADRDHGRLSRC